MTEAQNSKRVMKLVATVVAMVALVLSVSVLGGCNNASKAAKTYPALLDESELDSTIVGTMTYAGKSKDLTAREVIEDNMGIELAKTPEGKYKAPTADMVLGYARNKVMAQLIEEEGITPTEEQIQNFVDSNLGGMSIADLAKQYQMDEEHAKKIVTESVASNMLYDKIMGGPIGTEPTPPVAPAEGDATTPTKEYADYIIKLLGDEWDATNKTFKSADGKFASSLKDLNFNGETATYEQAQSVYYVVYAYFTQAQEELNTKWHDYVNGKFSDASISINTLIS